MTDDHTSLPDESPAERRRRLRDEAAQKAAAIGITPDLIKAVVHGFYDKVRRDDLLAPVFAGKVDDWAPHLEKMCAFWDSVMTSSGLYRGQPMPKHVVLPIDARHFERWLALFSETVGELCPPKAAAAFLERAGRIAQSLEMGLAGQHGIILGRNERFLLPEAGETQSVECASSPCGADKADQSYMWATKPTK